MNYVLENLVDLDQMWHIHNDLDVLGHLHELLDDSLDFDDLGHVDDLLDDLLDDLRDIHDSLNDLLYGDEFLDYDLDFLHVLLDDYFGGGV